MPGQQPDSPGRGGRKVIAGDAVTNVPHEGNPGETGSGPSIDRRLERVGVDKVGSQLSQEPGESSRVDGGMPGRAERETTGLDRGPVRFPGAGIHRQYRDGGSAGFEQAHQRAIFG